MNSGTSAVGLAGIGVIVLKGNLAPDGSLIKIAGLKTSRFEGPAHLGAVTHSGPQE